MARLRWLKKGIFFSVVMFLAFYFIIYRKIAFTDGIVILKLGNIDVTFLKYFLSDIKNVILSSLVVGFLLGLLPDTKFRKKTNEVNLNQPVQN
jgi:hypothetical protein